MKGTRLFAECLVDSRRCLDAVLFKLMLHVCCHEHSHALLKPGMEHYALKQGLAAMLQPTVVRATLCLFCCGTVAAVDACVCACVESEALRRFQQGAL